MLQSLMANNNVNSVYRINSDHHFFAEVVFRDNFEFISWLDTLKSAAHVDITLFQILKTEEKEKFLPE